MWRWHVFIAWVHKWLLVLTVIYLQSSFIWRSYADLGTAWRKLMLSRVMAFLKLINFLYVILLFSSRFAWSPNRIQINWAYFEKPHVWNREWGAVSLQIFLDAISHQPQPAEPIVRAGDSLITQHPDGHRFTTPGLKRNTFPIGWFTPVELAKT